MISQDFHKVSTNNIIRKNIVQVENDIYGVLSRGEKVLQDVIWDQHYYHEHRRWSVIDYLKMIEFDKLTTDDKHFVFNAGRAELTTKPGADRLTRMADKECRFWKDKDPILSSVMQACGTWSRYWNEEESHHEMSLLMIANMSGNNIVNDKTIIEYRGIFPDDDMLRTLTLLAFSECTAVAQYLDFAKCTTEPTLKKLAKQIADDEIQHMNNFICFAKALIESGHYSAKQVFSIGHLFLKKDGELEGVTRGEAVNRDGHVNWWDDVDDGNEKLRITNDVKRKRKLILSAIYKITGIQVASPKEVEDTWMDLVSC